MRRVVAGGTVLVALAGAVCAQGTKQWTIGKFDELERGTPEGVAIRSDGRLEAGPQVTTLGSTGSSYVWSVAEDRQGRVYAGLGGSSGGAAAVVRMPSAGGTPEPVFLSKEIGVQAVRVAPDGAVYAATSPDGKVYRLGERPGTETVVFDPAQTAEKPKYLWDLAVAADGTMYVAAGSPAVVYRVRPGGKAEVLFRTADLQMRSLLLRADGALWVGTDGSGVIYRYDTRAAGAKPVAVYAAGRKEITALAADTEGRVYAAAVGTKGQGALPPLPVTGAVGITVTVVQPGSTSAAGSNTVVPDGSEIDRIAADGTPEKMLTLPGDVVYALAVRGGQVLAASGNRGHVYRLDPAVPGRYTEVARLEAGQGTAMVDDKAGVVVGTSNGGKLVRLSDTAAARAVFTSEVFDAGQFSRWGRVQTEADAPGFAIAVRTGNVPSAVEGWSDWVTAGPDGTVQGVAPGRYAQWRAEMKPGGELDAVTLNYLPRNVAPMVDEIVVVPGARVQQNPILAAQAGTVQVVLPNAGSGAAQVINVIQPQDNNNAPLQAQKDRTAVTARWAAHDDNGDDLMFGVWYRGVGETTWQLLKDRVSERYLSFDASLLPDGRYELRVVASDAPDHTDADTRTGERVSAAFVLDTTPPVPGALTAEMTGGKVHWTMEARDAVTAIEHAEYSVDGGPWQYVEPVGGLSDSLAERYDATVPVPAGAQGQHVLAVRVYDRADNVASVKTVVR